MQQMIRFFKEIYLTGFAIFFNLSRAKDMAYKAGGPAIVITIIQGFFLEGLRGYFDIFQNKTTRIPTLALFIGCFTLYFMNLYYLVFRGHGVKFAREFHSLGKTKRIVLVVSFAVVSVAAIVFGIYAGVVHRRFFGLNN